MSVMDLFAKALEQDPQGGIELMNEVVYSYLADQADELRPELENLIATGMAEQVAVAKRALGRAYVASIAEGNYPSEEIQKNAKWVSDIEQFVVGIVSKDEIDTFRRTYNGREREVKARRDPLTGRFSRGISQKGETSYVQVPKDKLSPTIAQALKNPKAKMDEADEKNAKFNQFQWQEANRAAKDILRNFNDGEKQDIDLILNIQNPTTGYTFERIVPASDFDNKLPDSAAWQLEQRINSVGITTKPDLKNDSLSNKVAAFNTLGVTNNDTLQQLATIDPARLSALSSSLERKRPKDQTRLGTFFERLRTGGAVMEETDALRAYGEMARFIGVLGPEAEKVLSPYVQQAAYRYRGTEKEPDLALVSDFNSDMMTAVERAAESRSPQSEISTALRNAALENQGHSGKNDLVLQAASHQINNLDRTRGGRFTPDELVLNVRADVASRHLLNTLPNDPFVAEISRTAGNILPSQGVIIDADGDVVTQAVGFGDDHYLPFDFKNLRSLHGGQYVRTRQQGGLTGEDIYTAARTNARMATVVSSSGVFSLEFDPNFRGARANSDRARQMYDRYLKILDAVENSGLYVRDLDPAEKEKISIRARLVSDQTKQPVEDVNRALLKTAREKNLSELDYVGIQAEAEKQVSEEGRTYSEDRRARRVEDVFDELVNQEKSKRVSALSLNSKGYGLALETLQQQFPYFIRNVSFQPLTSKTPGEGFLQNLNQPGAAGARQRLGARDKGYVRRGDLQSSQVGYNDATTQMGASENNTETRSTTSTTAPSKNTTVKPMAATGDLMSVIARQNIGAMAEFQPEIKQFQMDMTKLPLGALPAGVEGFDETWEESKDDDLAALRYLINPANSQSIAGIIKSNPDRIAQVLSERDAVKSMLTFTYGDYANQTDPPSIPGFGDFDDLTDFFVDFGRQLRSVNSAKEPFVEPQADAAYYEGERPQLFSELASAKSTNDLDAVTQDNPLAQQLFESLLNEELDIADIQEESIEKIQTLKALKEALPELYDQYSTDNPDDMNLAALASIVVIPKSKVQAALEPNNIDMNEALTMDASAFDNQAMMIQQAWSAATAYNYLLQTGGGEPAPKAEPPLSWEVGKHYSSRQVQLVSKHHPLAKAIQERRRKNLPLL
jgi:hypothetical protein